MFKKVLLNAKISRDHAAVIEAHYTVYRLYEAADRDNFLAQAGPKSMPS